MRKDITPDRIANKLRQLRSQYAGSFLIVEGDTDARVWRNLVAETKCHVESASNKDKAIRVLEILEKDSFAGVLAIVDADFWRLEGTVTPSPNLLLTDHHDLEITLLQSPALEKLLGEHGSQDKIERLTRSCGKNIRNLLIDGALPIGYLRWHSRKERLELKFEDKSFKKFVNDRTLAVNREKLVQTVKNNSQKHELDDAELFEQMDSLKSDSHDRWSVCCGHDLIGILSLGLCKALGSNNYNQVAPDSLEKDLRLAYEASYFRDTQLYREIQDWEKNNEPFQVMAG